jgi:CheY-specific phosphatase CheX/anti-anti-sigma regulatory factor
LRPTIKNKVAIISPQGFLDSSNVESILWFEEIDFILKADVNALFISLQNIVFFNATAIQKYTDLFVRNIMSKKNIVCGFCDYDNKKYDLLLKYLGKDAKATLLDSFRLASLMYGIETHGTQKVLVWNENINQRSTILYKLVERGAMAVMANSKEEFESDASKESYEFRVENCYFGETKESVQHYTKSHMVVYTFSNFLDSSNTELFDHISLKNYLRLGFRVFILDCTLVTGINTHAIGFLSRLSKSNQESGAKFIIAGFEQQKMGQKAQSELESAGILFKINLEETFKDEDLIKIANEQGKSHDGKKGLSKSTIKALNVLVESTVQTIEMITKIQSKKLSIAMINFNLSSRKGGGYMGASIGFYGNIEGVILLMFQKDIAKNACSLLIGTDDIKESEILDSMGELINITMGKTKTVLQGQNLIIKTTLPRTFSTLEQIQSSFSNKDGVFMEFSFGDREFMFFLTA